MMPERSPWDKIKEPAADYNVRRVAGKTAVPCYWGRDTNGACLLIIELEGDHTAQYRKNITIVNGIGVDLRAGIPGNQSLVLTLEQQVDRDLFEGLCLTLVSSITHATDSASSLALALAHIRRWKTFLSGRAARQLSAEEVRGLFAELCFLLELMERMASSADAVAAWVGSDRSHQDFIFGSTSVEIKSVSGMERNSVRISSEDQLESLNDALFLRIYRLSNLSEASGTCSLNDIVAQVQTRLTEAAAVEELDRKLVARGYVPLPEYDEPRFIVNKTRTYRVEEGFPRLVRSTLPGGVAKVSYEIMLEAIESFETDGESVFEVL